MNADKNRKTCLVVINWNGWRDTKICIKSIFELSSNHFELIICDNYSSDGSCEIISEWLMRETGARRHIHTELDNGTQTVRFDGNFSPALKTIYIRRLSKNFGYAGAINRCIVWGREALTARDFWLLNNDVKLDPNALTAISAATFSVPNVGLCGSVLLNWDRPDSIQAIGGIYRRPFAVGWHLQNVKTGTTLCQDIFFDIDYPVGASLFVTQEYLDTVGLMDESYFLYYEEMDWVERGRRNGFRPAVALKSLVQHKEGASTGSHGSVRSKSLLSEHYGVVNRLRITRKFWPAYLPLVWLSLWLVVFDRLMHAEWARAGLVLRLIFEPQRWIRDKIA